MSVGAAGHESDEEKVVYFGSDTAVRVAGWKTTSRLDLTWKFTVETVPALSARLSVHVIVRSAVESTALSNVNVRVFLSLLDVVDAARE